MGNGKDLEEYEKKNKTVPAEQVVVAPLEEIPPIDERFLTDALESVSLIKGDNVMVPYFDGKLTFQVIDVIPAADAVLVTQKTTFHIAEIGETLREEIGDADALTTNDYVILSSLKLDNPRLQFQIGTIEGIDSTIKLFEIGYIRLLDRPLTFSEKEKLELWKDSPMFKQREAIIKKIADKEFFDKVKELKDKLGLKTGDEPLEITERGIVIFERKKKMLESLLDELKSIKLPSAFKQHVEKNKINFSLFVVMGIVNGSMMGHMMNKMEMNIQDAQMIGYDQGYADAGGDFGDAGGEGGGFMDGGFQPGF